MRTAQQLLFAGETPETLQRAIDDHYARKNEYAQSASAADKWFAILTELTTEWNRLRYPVA